VAPSNKYRYSFGARLLFWVQRRRFGQVLNSALAWGKIPSLYYPFAVFYALLERKRSPLAPLLRSLVMTRVAQVNACSFCIDLNASILMERMKAESKFNALDKWRDSSLFTMEEKLALEYGEAMSDTRIRVSDDLRKRLKEVFSEAQVLELTAAIAYQNMSAKFNAALDIPPQGFCQIRP
jgi:AhpD family alkylhydroperoxidase